MSESGQIPVYDRIPDVAVLGPALRAVGEAMEAEEAAERAWEAMDFETKRRLKRYDPNVLPAFICWMAAQQALVAALREHMGTITMALAQYRGLVFRHEALQKRLAELEGKP